MEHYPNSVPMKRRFDFDAFDKLCALALKQDEVMAAETTANEETQLWAEHDQEK